MKISSIGIKKKCKLENLLLGEEKVENTFGEFNLTRTRILKKDEEGIKILELDKIDSIEISSKQLWQLFLASLAIAGLCVLLFYLKIKSLFTILLLADIACFIAYFITRKQTVKIIAGNCEIQTLCEKGAEEFVKAVYQRMLKIKKQ